MVEICCVFMLDEEDTWGERAKNKHPCPPTGRGFLFTLKKPTASAWVIGYESDFPYYNSILFVFEMHASSVRLL